MNINSAKGRGEVGRRSKRPILYPTELKKKRKKKKTPSTGWGEGCSFRRGLGGPSITAIHAVYKGTGTGEGTELMTLHKPS